MQPWWEEVTSFKNILPTHIFELYCITFKLYYKVQAVIVWNKHAN